MTKLSRLAASIALATAIALTLPAAPAAAGTIEATTEPLLLCDQYRQFEEAVAAIKEGDTDWLAQSGCLQLRAPLKVSAIDCQRSLHLCHVRVWSPDGRTRTGFTLFQNQLN